MSVRFEIKCKGENQKLRAEVWKSDQLRQVPSLPGSSTPSASHVLHCPLIFLLSFLYMMVLGNLLLILVRLFMYLFISYSLEMLKGLSSSTSVWLFILLLLGTNQELVILYLNLETMGTGMMTSICWMNIWGQIWKVLREKAKKTWSICNWHMFFLMENIPKGHGNWLL